MKEAQEGKLKLICEGGWWAQLGLNQRPLRCHRSALPLSYAPLLGLYTQDSLEVQVLEGTRLKYKVMLKFLHVMLVMFSGFYWR